MVDSHDPLGPAAAVGGGAAAPQGREERKAARRERIARAVVRLGDKDSATAGSGGATVGKGRQAAADALAYLDKKKAAGIDSVTAVRVAADDREARRRVGEERLRQERLQRLQEEAVRSGRHNAAIEMRWAELLEQNMPQELHDEVEAQKAACARVVAGKDALVAAFQAQLKAKDEEYIKGLKQQAEEVEELLTRMRTETRELRDAYDAELEAVDEACLQERDELLAANKAEMDALFEKRRETDLLLMERKQRLQERQTRELEDMLTRDAEEYSKLKVKLESDVAALEQQLEEMRATYQLNTEKLEYNYRVLTERDVENSATLAHQKRRLTRLKDALSGLLQRCQETDGRDRRRNEDLTEEYRRITRQYKDLQAKFRHFEVADEERYEQVFAMHREDVLALTRRVLQADQVIHAQLLGWDWRPPDMDLLLLPAERQPAAAAAPAANATGSTSGPQALSPTSVSAAIRNVRDEASPAGGSSLLTSPQPAAARAGAAAGSAAAASGAVTPGAVNAGASGQSQNLRISSARMKVVMTLLAQEARFLVDEKVRAALQVLSAANAGANERGERESQLEDESRWSDDAKLAAAESALSVLGVRSGGDMEALVAYFFRPEDPEVDYEEPVPHADFAAVGLAAGGGSEPDALRALLTAIQPDDVVRAIRAFVEDRAASISLSGGTGNSNGAGAGSVTGGGGMAGATGGGGGSGRGLSLVSTAVGTDAGGGGGDAGRAQRQRERILKRREEESWERPAQVLGEQGELVWERLERGLVSYNGLLAERARRIAAVDELHRQNAQLKTLLGQYLGSSVNQDLLVPPTHTMRAAAAQAY